MERTTDRVVGDPHRDGDGRVPLASATLENVAIRYARGLHGSLTNIPSVYEDVFRWLHDEPLQLPDDPQGALVGHLANSDVSDAPALDGSSRITSTSDDSGYWHDMPPDAAAMAALDAELATNALPDFIRVRLL